MRYLVIILLSLFFSLGKVYSLTIKNPTDDEKKKSSTSKVETASTSILEENDDNDTEGENTTEEESDDIDHEESDEFDIADDADTLNYLHVYKYKREGWNINDSLQKIPAYDLYCNWNTSIIHPLKKDLTNKPDTTFIFLQDETQCDYYHPFEGHITSNFGPRKKRYHYGIDIKLEIGDSVAAAFEGTVRIAQMSKSYGNVVVIRHNNGLETLYAHLSKIHVNVGDHLQSGDILGLGGNTGRSTGSHLHFEVRYLGAPINPNDIISFNEYKLKADVLALNKSHFAYLIKAKKEGYIYSKNSKFHTIRKGDTLSKISRRYGVSINKLCKLNGIKSTTSLRIGRKIRLS